MVARTAAIAPTAKVLRIEARDEELPFALRQSLSLATVEHAGPARTGHMVSIQYQVRGHIYTHIC
jgi:hypothetical protein